MDFIAFIAAGHDIIIYVCFFLSNLNVVTYRGLHIVLNRVHFWWEITLVWSTANFSIRTFIQMSDFENQLPPPPPNYDQARRQLPVILLFYNLHDSTFEP